MSWEQWTERVIHNGGFWLAHINYVAVWALLSLTLLLLSVRLLLQQVLVRRQPRASEGRERHWAFAIALVPASLLTGYMAIRPDPTFYLTIANSAFEAGDCRQAADYYSPLVSWGSEDLQAHTRLAACQLKLGRLESALQTLLAARGLPDGDTAGLRLWAVGALEGLGRLHEAARELDGIYQTTPPGPDRDRVARELERVHRAAGGGDQ